MLWFLVPYLFLFLSSGLFHICLCLSLSAEPKTKPWVSKVFRRSARNTHNLDFPRSWGIWWGSHEGLILGVAVQPWSLPCPLPQGSHAKQNAFAFHVLAPVQAVNSTSGEGSPVPNIVEKYLLVIYHRDYLYPIKIFF